MGIHICATSGLTERQAYIVRRLADGCTARMISGELGNHPKTVEHSIGQIARHYGLEQRCDGLGEATQRRLAPRIVAAALRNGDIT